MQRRSVSILAVAYAGIGLVGYSSVAKPHPMIIWNASASVPVGLYRAAFGTPKQDDFVLVMRPNAMAVLADKRGYLPVGVPLVKRVAAVTSDKACALHGLILINGKAAARQLETDRSGRLLPHWKDCRSLERGEYFLLGDAPDSFDSRYFGPVKSDRLIGRLVPLWTE